MPPINQKALDALNALSSGGSSGLDAYNQAQQKEQASRTGALQGALGGNGVYDAAMKSQAQYAPKVAGTGFQDAGSLLPAANQYLTEAADRISSENYVSHLKDTAKNRDAQLLGAAEVLAQKQRGELQGNLDKQFDRSAIDKLTAEREALTNERSGMVNPNTAVLLTAARKGTPEGDLAQGTVDKLNDISARQAANEAALREAMAGYAQAAGTDTKGYDEALAKGDMAGIRGLTDFIQGNQMQGRRETLEGQGLRDIEVGGQARLRELAPLFGMDPLEAEGKFRSGEGDDLARASQRGKEAGYVEGGMSSEDYANALEIDPKAYQSIKTTTGLTDEQVAGTVQSPDFADITDMVQSYIAQGGASPDEDGNFAQTGSKGLRQYITNTVSKMTDADGKPLSDAEKSKLVVVATQRFLKPVKYAFGEGEEE